MQYCLELECSDLGLATKQEQPRSSARAENGLLPYSQPTKTRRCLNGPPDRGVFSRSIWTITLISSSIWWHPDPKHSKTQHHECLSYVFAQIKPPHRRIGDHCRCKNHRSNGPGRKKTESLVVPVKTTFRDNQQRAKETLGSVTCCGFRGSPWFIMVSAHVCGSPLSHLTQPV